MKKEISREEAIEKISKWKLEQLTKKEREDLLLNWWCLDEDDPEFFYLPDELKMDMKNLDFPNDSNESKYDVLLLLAIKSKFKGIHSEYLEKQLRQANIGNFQVKGEPEILYACPCCGYLTLNLRGNYDICPVCFWEDDGTEQEEQYSGVNRSTLREARDNFIKVGSIYKEDTKIDIETRERYLHV